MSFSDRLSTALSLGALAYLGFYIFGLIMGIYSPGEVIGFTIGAAAAAFYVVQVIRGRRASAESSEEAMREAHRLREERGF
jgi:threonine/homoserine efflux transporter RhtA